MDVEDQLSIFQTTLVDYCDEYSLVNETSLFLATLNFLAIRDNLSESYEAMEIHVNAFCRYEPTPYAVERLRHAIRVYIHAMHDLFIQSHLYQEDSHLAYTFGGWLQPFAAIFVPHTHAEHYPQAQSALVQSEPYGTNPFDLVATLTSRQLIHQVYHVALQPEEIPY